MKHSFRNSSSSSNTIQANKGQRRNFLSIGRTSPLILYQLVDSCVPSGGFAHSNTLEAAHQLHILKCTGSSWKVSLREHCFDVLVQTFTATVPFLIATCDLFRSHYHAQNVKQQQEEKEGSYRQSATTAITAGVQLCPQHDETILNKFEDLDKELCATMNSHVACRASTTQGSGMLRAFSAAFPDIAPVIKLLRRRLIQMTPCLSMSQISCYGHAATCFGSVCGLLDINNEACTSMFLYTTAR